MKNLQDLYDSYLETRPSSGKIKSATAMMIHVCKALDISSQEEVTHEYFESIPGTLDSYFYAHPNKATMDKTILAEMIGRVGPKKKVKKLLDKLLTDEDENVRQFTLHSLEYYGAQNIESILPYIEKFKQSSDDVLLKTAAMLVGNLQCWDKNQIILGHLKKWYDKNDIIFVEEVIKRMVIMRQQNKCDNHNLSIDEIKAWSLENCPKVAAAIFSP
jgi:hypothetical protein